jgi:ABC-type phosphate transport system substrate-binding protein
MLVVAFYCMNAFAARVIVHQSVDASTLTKQELRLIFSMQKLYWKDGTRIQVFVLPSASPIHQEFCYQQLDLMPYVLQHRWDRLVFSGVGDRPILVDNEEEMLNYVTNTLGGIGYVADKKYFPRREK